MQKNQLFNGPYRVWWATANTKSEQYLAVTPTFWVGSSSGTASAQLKEAGLEEMPRLACAISDFRKAGTFVSLPGPTGPAGVVSNWRMAFDHMRYASWRREERHRRGQKAGTAHRSILRHRAIPTFASSNTHISCIRCLGYLVFGVGLFLNLICFSARSFCPARLQLFAVTS